jgi:hypothetical protein
MSEIEYSGPNLGYTPSDGNNQEGEAVSKALTPVSTSYANKSYLNDKITQLIAETNLFMGDLNRDLQDFGLSIDPADTKLFNANTAEWPTTALGPPKNHISFRYYTSLELRNSSAATYIRRRYEEAARNVNGNNSIDLIALIKMISNEASLVQEFVNTHVGILDDSSEQRTVELLQDWVESALHHTGKLRTLFETRDTPRQLPGSDLDQIGPEEARQSQALFKVNLNKVNGDLTTALGYIQKNFSDYASVFYKNFLGPAVSFRTNVTRKVYPILPGELGRHVNVAVNSVDNHLATVLADQTRRNLIFDHKMGELTQLVQMRDQYRSYITQLATREAPVPTSATDLIHVTDTPDEADYFNQPPPLPPVNEFTSPHDALGDRDGDGAHPQYLLKDGGKITGNVTLADGVKIDGISPHLHRHTGQDGTDKIHGEDIQYGTVTTGVIDHNDLPKTPIGLALDTLTPHTVPPGMTVFDADVSWEAEDGLTYEVQIVSIGSMS